VHFDASEVSAPRSRSKQLAAPQVAAAPMPLEQSCQ